MSRKLDLNRLLKEHDPEEIDELLEQEEKLPKKKKRKEEEK